MSPPKVSILVLNWNKKDMTIECIDSLKKIKYPNYEILVIDNGSTDGSYRAFKKMGDIKTVQTGKNLGYTGGNNAGMRKAKGDYVLVLNNDVIVDPDFLNELVRAAESDPQIGIVGPKVYYNHKKNVIFSAGGYTSKIMGLGILIGLNKIDRGQYEKQKKVNMIPGCCMLIKRKVLDKVGYFDDNFYIYFDEMDYCLRAIDSGFKCVYVPKSVIWHKVAGSTGDRDDGNYIYKPNKFRAYYVTRNRLYLIDKHANLLEKLLFLPWFVWLNAVSLVIYSATLKFDISKAILKGIRDNALNNMGKSKEF